MLVNTSLPLEMYILDESDLLPIMRDSDDIAEGRERAAFACPANGYYDEFVSGNTLIYLSGTACV